MRVLVTGSRAWEDEERIAEAMHHAWALVNMTNDPIPTLVHGGAFGADQMAARIARRWKWQVETHLAQWRPHGIYNPRAGILRNSEMVALGADICLAFVRNGSPGATDCGKKAESAGIPVRWYVA